jgi:hypothetical protein
METIHGQKMVDNSVSSFIPSGSFDLSSSNRVKRLKFREFISWSVCFGVISFLTGLLKFLKIGVTMDSVTSVLFYLSLAGLFYFTYKVLSLSKNSVQRNSESFHGLN